MNSFIPTLSSGRGDAPLGHAIDDPQDRTPVVAKYLQIVMRRRVPIAITVALAVLAALVYSFVATPIYTARAAIEIARQQENIVKVDGVQPESAGFDQEFYQTQYSLLESTSLMDRVSKNLKLAQDPAFVRYFNIDADTGGLLSFGAEPTAREREDELQRQVREALSENVQISPVRGSRIVNILFSSADSQLSARIANAWIEAFIASNLDRKVQSSSFATRYLQTQLIDFRNRLERSERDLVEYANANRIITLNAGASGNEEEAGSGGTIADANLGSLNRAYAQARANRIAAESRLRSQSSDENLTNQTLTRLRAERANLAAEYARILTAFEPEYPGAIAIKSQLDELGRAVTAEELRVVDNLRRAFTAAQTEEQRLAQAVSGLEGENLDQRRRGIQYNIYQREVDTNRELYDGLLQRFKEIGLAAGIGPNNIGIVDVALPPEDPTSPNLVNNLLAGLALGLLGALATVLVMEQLFHKLRSPEDVEAVTSVPVLGAIPRQEETDIETWSDPKSQMFEAYMSVQTALRLATEQGVPKSLAITSTGPGEGKSMTCLSLARALRSSGKSVLVVDADLRRPSISAKLGIPNKEGLSEYLAGQADWAALLKDTHVDGIAVLTAGTIPPNPTELLAGHRFVALLDQAATRFDHVLIDSPPLLGLADAPLISERTEGSIYVVEANNVSADDLRAGLRRLSRNAQRILGIILTKYRPAKGAAGYYAYEYSYETAGKAA